MLNIILNIIRSLDYIMNNIKYGLFFLLARYKHLKKFCIAVLVTNQIGVCRYLFKCNKYVHAHIHMFTYDNICIDCILRTYINICT